MKRNVLEKGENGITIELASLMILNLKIKFIPKIGCTFSLFNPFGVEASQSPLPQVAPVAIHILSLRGN